MNRQNKISNRISPLHALAIWLFLLVLPLLLLNHGIIEYSGFLRQRLILLRQSFLNDELYAFIDDLQPQNFVQSRFDNADANYLQKAADADELCGMLQQKTGIEIAAVFFRTGSKEAIKTAFSKNLKQVFVAPPQYFLKKTFEVLAFENVEPGTNQDKERKSAASIFRSIFGNISEIKLKSGIVVKTISSKTGDTGPVYFYYFREQDSERAFIALIREDALKPQRIINAALQKKGRKTERRIVRSKIGLEFPDQVKAKGISTFLETEDGIEVRTVLPIRNIIHLVQRGTIVPVNVDRFVSNLPLISVFLPNSALMPKIWQYHGLIRFLSLLALLVGSIFLLRFCLFGFTYQFSITSRIFTGLSVTGFFPVVFFVFAYSSFAEFERVNLIQQGRQMLAQRMSMLQKKVNSGINELELFNVRLTTELEQMHSAEKKIQRLEEVVDKVPERSFFVIPIEGKGEKIGGKEKAKDMQLNRFESDALNLFAMQMFDMLKNSPFFEQDRSTLSRFFNDVISNRGSLSVVLKAFGKLIIIEKLTRKFWFSCMMILQQKNQRFLPSHLLFPALSVERAMKQQFAEARKDVALHHSAAGFSIDLALAFRGAEDIAIEPENASKRIDVKAIAGNLRIAAQVKREMVWETVDGIEMVRYDETLPLICYGRIRIHQEDGLLTMEAILKMILYLILLIVVVAQVVDRFFVNPVKKFADGMLEVSTGNLKYKFENETGDEFDRLSRSLNSMLQGLIEKETLAVYVSDDVRNDVEKDYEGGFAPGGEMIKAAVLFCEPLEFSDFAEASDPLMVVNRLNFFVGKVSQICSQHGGVIDKVVEHNLMLVFRQKKGLENHVLRAASAARQISLQVNRQNEEFPFVCRIGLACGEMISGKIGSTIGKLDFTVIGDRVNLAARLKALAHKATRTGILISAEIRSELGNFIEAEKVDTVEIKGKSGKYDVYELLEVKPLFEDAKRS
ncbi:MAG: adenylate/guanylate cyclase domain-containing protein [Candidatus Rifleibacteriota bacterium]